MARVLIVDDMVSIRRIVKTLLGAMGHEVEEADNGISGYQRACDGRFDLIISDWNMPKSSGSDLVRELKQNAATRDVPVIMLTAEAERGRIVELAQLGVKGYVLKPFKPDTLETVVKKILQA